MSLKIGVILAAAWLACLAGGVYICVKTMTAFAGYAGLFLIGAFASIPFLIVGIYRHYAKSKSRVLIGSIFSFSLFSLILVVSGFIEEKKEKQTRAVGDSIVQALEKYHAAKGAYPKTLQALVPDYFPAVPSGFMGWGPTGFKLEENGTDGFDLCSPGQTFTMLCYASDRRKWRTVD